MSPLFWSFKIKLSLPYIKNSEFRRILALGVFIIIQTSLRARHLRGCDNQPVPKTRVYRVA